MALLFCSQNCRKWGSTHTASITQASGKVRLFVYDERKDQSKDSTRLLGMIEILVSPFARREFFSNQSFLDSSAY
jgi:hypothetical protein